MAKDKIVKAGNTRRALIKAIAMDIGRDMVAYIEVMYPKAFEVTPSTFRISVKHHVYNDIVGLLDANLDTDEKILAWLKERGDHRRRWLKAYRDIRRREQDHKIA